MTQLGVVMGVFEITALATLLWITAVYAIRVYASATTALLAVLATALLLLIGMKPMIDGVFGTRVGDEDAVIGATLWLGILAIGWISAFFPICIMALGEQRKAASTRGVK